MIFSRLTISFNVLLGSEERAAKLVNDIQDLANVTPMTSSGLQENAKHEDFYKKINVDLYLEAPIQELSRLANRLADIAYKLNK